MDLLHEELKEPTVPMASGKETVSKKTVNPKSSQPKRLLGGTTVVEMPSDDSVPSNVTRFNLGVTEESFLCCLHFVAFSHHHYDHHDHHH